MVQTTDDDSRILFDGSNWQDLNRMIALAKFQFLQDDDYDNNHPRRCAYVSQRFTGPALDWVASIHSTQPTTFENFDSFVSTVRDAFGVDDTNITAILRQDLDKLAWGPDVPTFFAEFDRLCTGLNVVGHDVKIAMVEAKLPLKIKILLSEQALSFANYDTMRQRLNIMWALDPQKGGGGSRSKPRCGSCGKRGHSASDCRSKN